MNQISSTWWRVIAILAVLIAVASAWSYWPTLVELAEEWTNNPLYSHGYLVPVFAISLLWIRREKMPKSIEPSWWAVVFLLLAITMRLAAAHFYFSWPERGSVLVMLFGCVLAVGGWATIRWTWPTILFLGFMLPFPGVVETSIMRPLQRISTILSTNALQTFGFFAQADGNVIVLSELDMGIVEACSGLRMVSVFMALTVGSCFLMRRPIWQKCVIVLSCFPIAVACNVARITATGVLYEVSDREFAEFVFHDLAGWLMMPLALLLLLLEVKIFDLIYVIESVPAASQDPNQAIPQGHSSPAVSVLN
jgi:exosortase